MAPSRRCWALRATANSTSPTSRSSVRRTASDAIYASAAYCPTTDLAHADGAYEWQFGTTPLGSSLVDQGLSAQLASGFAAYLTSLDLVGRSGFGTLNADNYADYLMQTLLCPFDQGLSCFALRQRTPGLHGEPPLDRLGWQFDHLELERLRRLGRQIEGSSGLRLLRPLHSRVCAVRRLRHRCPTLHGVQSQTDGRSRFLRDGPKSGASHARPRACRPSSTS